MELSSDRQWLHEARRRFRASGGAEKTSGSYPGLGQSSGSGTSPSIVTLMHFIY